MDLSVALRQIAVAVPLPPVGTALGPGYHTVVGLFAGEDVSAPGAYSGSGLRF